ncbi:hypothetical protein ElyMa_002413900 [Elysia marginata]|uniref:Secreted protein n=1 Tax=Elysia marginata TaxID=1093978 RepID=A0AAV4GES6_9GAST|nr:hypothetical protein ElyMa_002413900 [Elysia marginata]
MMMMMMMMMVMMVMMKMVVVVEAFILPSYEETVSGLLHCQGQEFCARFAGLSCRGMWTQISITPTLETNGKYKTSFPVLVIWPVLLL